MVKWPMLTTPRAMRARYGLLQFVVGGLILCLLGCGSSADRPSPASSTPTPLPSVATTTWVYPAGWEPDRGLATVDEGQLYETVHHLASPELEGRASGEGGDVLAAALVAAAFESAGLEPGGDDGGYLQRFAVTRGSQETFNVIGILEGGDPALRGESVVVGAHLDHLGVTATSYYPGGDDNASGTAAVMELAEAFGALRSSLRRTMVFVAFSGEELGLLGSRHYVESPTFPIASTRFMLDLDMVGHLDPAGGMLTAYNVTSSPGLVTFVNEIASRYRGFTADLQGASTGSDHAPFAARGVPVVFLHTGLSSTYHRTTDTADTLNYAGLRAVTAFGLELAWRASFTTDLSGLASPGDTAPQVFALDHDASPFVLPRR